MSEQTGGQPQKRWLKTAAKYLAVFCAAAALMLALLLGAALIPREANAGNMRESAEYLAGSALFPLAVEGVEGSRIDRYADAILLNIGWNYDAEHPFRSAMLSAYYYSDWQNENDNLLDAVTKGERSEERRVGKECELKCRSRWSPYH